MLNRSTLAKVYEALEESSFTLADFAITPGSSNGSMVLSIRFRHESNYGFDIRVGSDGSYYTTESPGEFRNIENRPLKTMSSLQGRIREWTAAVRADLRASIPVYSELDELRATIEQHIKDHVADSENQFTPDEIAELKTQLDLLSEKFFELSERNEITQQEVAKLNEELSMLKSNLETYPKGTWYKTAGTKIWAVTSKILSSKESRQLIAQAARKAIGLETP